MCAYVFEDRVRARGCLPSSARRCGDFHLQKTAAAEPTDLDVGLQVDSDLRVWGWTSRRAHT
jgi:hypothetical protein